MRARHPSRWDEFTKTAPRRLPDRLHISLNPKGEFVITISVFEKLNTPEAVVLMYDRETHSIGVKASRLDVPHAVAIHKRHKRYNKVFRSKKFLEKHRLVLRHALQFPTAVIDTDGVLVLNLREAVAASDMPRLPRAPAE